MSNFRRKLMFMQQIEEPIELPFGYTKYDWIQGDDTAYIDSGLRYYTEMATDVDFKLPSDVIVGRDAPIVGATYYASSYMQFGGGVIFSRRFSVQYGGQSTILSTIPATYVGAKLKAIAQMTQGQQSLQIKSGGAVVVSGTGTSTMNGTTKVSDIRVAQNGNVRLYRVKIYSDYDMENLAWDGVPCVNIHGQKGMFDLISMTFFGNAASSGRLTVGNDNGIILHEWIQSDGDAYIETGLTTNDHIGWEAEWQNLPSDAEVGAGDKGILYSTSYQKRPAINGNTYIWYINYRFWSSNVNRDLSSRKGQRIRSFLSMKNRSQTCYTYLGTGNSKLYTDVGTDIYTQSYGGYAIRAINSIHKVYSIKIYNDETHSELLFNGVPAENANGEIGLYDQVSKTLFTNASGSGQFTIGD